MSKGDDCFDEIVALATREDADAIEKARSKANEYLAPFGLTQTATERMMLVARLRADGPKTPLMEQIVLAIEAGA
jgi:hypothetical protein